MARKTVAFCDICGEEIPRSNGLVLVVNGKVWSGSSYGNFDLCEKCNYVIRQAKNLKMVILCFSERRLSENE